MSYIFGSSTSRAVGPKGKARSDKYDISEAGSMILFSTAGGSQATESMLQINNMVSEESFRVSLVMGKLSVDLAVYSKSRRP